MLFQADFREYIKESDLLSSKIQLFLNSSVSQQSLIKVRKSGRAREQRSHVGHVRKACSIGTSGRL